MSAPPSLEDVFTSRHFFGVESATPVQRAICRIAEGVPLGNLACDRDVVEAAGGDEAVAILTPGSFRPRELDLLCAIRSGKSFFVAAHAIWSSWTVNLDTLRPGEIPRFAVLSVNTRSADATFNILAGTILNRPALKSLLIGDVGADSLFLRHPSGRTIECTVAAGARAGANLISVWLAGCAFEEYSRQASEGTGAVVNYEAQLQAAAGRVVEGGQILSAGSPWAPFGAAYERFASGFGRPSPDRVIIKAPGPVMNPRWWTPERCASLQRSNPTAYVTDVLAGFADPTTAFIPQSDIRAATREEPLVLPPRSGRGYQFAMDPGTRGNAWTLVGVAYYADADRVTRFEVVLCRQWIGSTLAPLRPLPVMKEIAQAIRPYNAGHVFTDQHGGDFLVPTGERVSVRVIVRTVSPGNSPEPSTGVKPNPGRVFKNDLFETLKGAFSSGVITIPNDRVLVNDLLSIRRRLTATGVTYDLPVTSDGRHCDYVPALALALSEFPAVASLRVQLARAERDRRYEYVGAILAGTAPVGKAEEYFALANGTTTIDQLRTPAAVRMAAGEQRWRDGDGAYRTALDWNHLLQRTGSPVAVSDEALDAKFGRGPTSVQDGET